MNYRPPMENGVANPHFLVYINGKEVPKEYYNLIEEIVYESHENGSDLASIFIRDPLMVVMGDKNLLKGASVGILGGWRGDLDRWLTGFITMVDVEFPESGDPLITLHCMDESYRLDRVDVKFSYSKTTFSQVAQAIATRYGLSVRGKPTETTHESISQANETDMKLLIRLAEQEGLIVKVRNGTITWRDKEDIGGVVDSLYWRVSPFTLGSFAPRTVLADRKEVVDESDVDTDSGETNTGSADRSTNRNKLGTDDVMGGWRRDSVNNIWVRESDKE